MARNKNPAPIARMKIFAGTVAPISSQILAYYMSADYICHCCRRVQSRDSRRR